MATSIESIASQEASFLYFIIIIFVPIAAMQLIRASQPWTPSKQHTSYPTQTTYQLSVPPPPKQHTSYQSLPHPNNIPAISPSPTQTTYQLSAPPPPKQLMKTVNKGRPDGTAAVALKRPGWSHK